MVTKASVDAVLDKIDGFVGAEMDHFGTPGVAVSVVYDDVVLFSKGYGVREVGKTDPITPETVFSLASMSKPISGTAVAHLVARGVVAWDQPVHEHVPGLRFSDPWVTDHITFADLYSHRSGLPGLFGNTLEHIGYTRDEILARLPLIPLDPFRATYSYSNFGMTAGGDAAANAAGTTFEDMIEEQLFAPAAMTRSSARYTDLLAEPDRSAIHIEIGGTWTVGPTRRPDAQAPAGGVSSSLTDVTRWVRLVLGGGTLDGEEIIGKDALATTHVPHIVRAPLSTYDAHPQLYGLGWNVETDHLGFLRWSHSGAFSSGAATTTVLLPQERLGIVVLTNGMPQGVPEIIADEILEQIVLGTLTRDWRLYWYDGRFSFFYKEVRPDRAGRSRPGPRRGGLPRHLRERLLRRGLGHQRRRRSGAGPRATPAHGAADPHRREHLLRHPVPRVAQRPLGDHVHRRERRGHRGRHRRRRRPPHRSADPAIRPRPRGARSSRR